MMPPHVGVRRFQLLPATPSLTRYNFANAHVKLIYDVLKEFQLVGMIKTGKIPLSLLDA
jgi:hypothetical protein